MALLQYFLTFSVKPLGVKYDSYSCFLIVLLADDNSFDLENISILRLLHNTWLDHMHSPLPHNFRIICSVLPELWCLLCTFVTVCPIWHLFQNKHFIIIMTCFCMVASFSTNFFCWNFWNCFNSRYNLPIIFIFFKFFLFL